MIYRSLEYDGYIQQPQYLLRWGGHEWGSSHDCLGGLWELLDLMTEQLLVPESSREKWLREHGDDRITLLVTEWHPMASHRGKTLHTSLGLLNDFGLRRSLPHRIAAYGKKLRRMEDEAQG
jgi:hypothetical protein